MKTLVKSLAVILVVGFLCSVPQRVTAQSATVSFQVFYDGLSPYGAWIDYPGYGYVWVPNAGADFAPYATAGHWVYTDDGWMWVSDYPWGWAPFHYGRWIYDNDDGWLWVPGEEWAPAWVSWRFSAGYYGWAPLGYGFVAPERYCFVRDRYITSPHVYRYYEPRRSNSTYINNSTVINNTHTNNVTHATYISGPRREDVEKATGGHVTPATVQSSSRPGQSVGRNSVSVYRPTVNKTTSANPKPAPTKVASASTVQHQHGNMQKTSSPANNSKPAATQHNSPPAKQNHQSEKPVQNTGHQQQSTQHNQQPRQQQSTQHSQQPVHREQPVQHTQQPRQQQQMQQRQIMPPRQQQMQPHQGNMPQHPGGREMPHGGGHGGERK